MAAVLREHKRCDDKLNRFVREVGGCGTFQVLCTAASYLVCCTGAWGMLYMSFGNYDPGWTCVDGLDTATGQFNVTSHTSAPTVRANTSDADTTCSRAAACSDLRFNPESSTVVTEWSLICDRSWLGSLIISIQMAGALTGSFVSGQIGERFGRKKNMLLWDLFLGVTSVVAVFSVNWQMYAANWFAMGMSIGGIMTSSQLYPLEFTTGKWRAFITGFPNWNIGCVTFSVCVYILKDWRHVHIATAILCGVALLPFCWMPESLRWLAVHGKTKEARAVALKICRYNKMPRPGDDTIDFADCEGLTVDKRATVINLFQRSLIKKTILCALIFFFMSFMYYAIGFGIGSLFGDFYLNFILYTSVMIPAFPLIPILGNKLGRRWGSVILLSVALLASLTIVVVSFTVEGELRGNIVTGLTLTTSMFVGLSWNLLVSFIVELFPTSVRSLGFSFSYVSARLGGIVAPYLLPRQSAAMFVSFLVMASLAFVCCAMILALPETNNRGLEDVMATGVNAKRQEKDQDAGGITSDSLLHNEKV